MPYARPPPRCFLACWVVLAVAAHAADPQPYAVTLSETGDAGLDRVLADSSTLLSLRESAPVGPFALVARAQEDVRRFTAALESQGFYQAKIGLRVAGRALDDPELYALLERAPAQPPVEVAVAVEPGPLFRLRKLEIVGDVPERVRAKLNLVPGDAALAAEVLAGRERLLEGLRGQGHALARVEAPVATLVPEAEALDVVYRVEAGPSVDLGPVTVQGLQRMDADFVRRRLLVAEGEPFDPQAIEQARQDLAKLGVFATVRARPAEAVDGQGRLPLAFEVVERPRHATSLGAAWSTDLGGSLSSTWQHRNLLGEAEQVNLSAAVTQIGGNSTTGIGYKAGLGFAKPDFLQRGQSLLANVGGVKQSLDAYDQKSFTFDASLQRKFADYWSASLGLAFEQSRITQQGVTHDYTLASLPATLKYDSTGNLLDPVSGVRAAVSVTPVHPLAGATSGTFVLMQASASAYWDLAGAGRSVLALRGTVGDAEGAGQFDLPPDKRFYAGGSATVRGYKYQSIGPSFPDGSPQGGTALAAGTVELRQRILDSYGAVVFADLGQVNADGLPFTGTWRLGAGLGARYYTGFGPLRLDVALPVNKQPGSGSFEVYIGLGQAF